MINKNLHNPYKQKKHLASKGVGAVGNMLKIKGEHKSFESFIKELKKISKFDDKKIDVRLIRTEIKKENDAIRIFLKGGGFKEKTRYGCILHITKNITFYAREQIVNILLYYDKVYKVFYLFTNEGISKMDIVLNFVQNHKHFHEIWLPPAQFDEFSDELLEQHQGEIVYFRADRDMSLTCDRRPEIERNIEYEGRDGYLTLKELMMDYGVLPVKLTFNFPKLGKFKIYREGKFIFESGDFEFFISNVVFSFVSHAIKIDNVFEDSIIDVKIEHGLPRYFMILAEIRLSASFDNQKFNDFLSLLKKNDFDVYNETLVDDVIFMNGYVIDKKRDEIFSLTYCENYFSLVPRYDSTYHSLHSFYRFVIENIDSKAKCMTVAA